VHILKEIDQSSPLLWSALVSNENLTTWQLKFWAPAATGIETEIYTITLTNASIASIHEYMPDNEDPAKAKLPLLEKITFTYQKIEWVWTKGTITAGGRLGVSHGIDTFGLCTPIDDVRKPLVCGFADAKISTWNCPAVKFAIALCKAEMPVLTA
jgi:hypothetical protein